MYSPVERRTAVEDLNLPGGMTSCGLVNSRRRFGGGRCLHLQCVCTPRRFCTECADPEGEGSRFL